ncbi:hypothetical protein EDD16DRAFT_1526138 [Pisolithus croceorrhizus]|nr:hypothetical protein EDD16DRAFT_1526138 [Pisolithus croceorrhizus]
MELSPFLLLLLQQLLVLEILSLMMCLRDSLLTSPTSLSTFCMIPLKILLEGGCIIHSWRSRNVVGEGWWWGAEQVVVAEMQGKWLREKQDSWDKAPWGAGEEVGVESWGACGESVEPHGVQSDGVANQDIEQQGQEGDPEISSLSLLKVYTPEVPEGDLANLGQGLVGGDVGGESPEYAGHTQIGKVQVQREATGKVQGKATGKVQGKSTGKVQGKEQCAKWTVLHYPRLTLLCWNSTYDRDKGTKCLRQKRLVTSPQWSQPQKSLSNQQTHGVESMKPGSRDLRRRSSWSTAFTQSPQVQQAATCKALLRKGYQRKV